jgi:hypothetical protein
MQPSESWVVDDCPALGGHWTIRHADGTDNGDIEQQPIATVYEAVGRPNEWRADLIAASPALLRAAEALMLRMTNHGPDDSNLSADPYLAPAVQDLAAAIRQARGQE